MTQIDMDKWLNQVKIFLATQTRSNESDELTGHPADIAEYAHSRAAAVFASLLHEPLCASTVVDLDKPRPERIAKIPLEAVGVHSAGDLIPTGRQATVSIAKNTFLNYLNWIDPKEHIKIECWNVFINLFLLSYWKLFERRDTIVHHLLHNFRQGNKVIVYHFHGGDPSEEKKKSQPTFAQIFESHNIKLYDVSFNSLWDLFAPSEEELKVLGKAVYKRTLSILTESNGDTILNEVLTDDAANIAKILELSEPSIKYILEQKAHEAVVLLRKQEKLFEESLVEHFAPDPEVSGRKRDDEIERLVRMLQLFLLYRKLCGEHFYIFTTPVNTENLRFCILFGSSNLLPEEDLTILSEIIHPTVTTTVEILLRESRDKYLEQADEEGQEDLRLLSVIGKRLVDTLNHWSAGKTKKRFNAKRRPFLSDYLKFCERLSNIAVHEGKRLQFNIIIAGGNFSSKRVEILSGWGGKRRSLSIRGDTTEVEEAVALLLGNYNFLQQQGCVIFADYYGHLLYLGRVMPRNATSEELTEGEECYLVRIETNGDIKVFYDGALSLWRRGAEWVVPMAYGDAYKKKLHSALLSLLPRDIGFSIPILTDAIWKIVSNNLGGATFVIGDWDRGDFPLNKVSYAMTEVFRHAEGQKLVTPGNLEMLIALAVQDGATIIDQGTGKVYGRRQLVPAFKTKKGGIKSFKPSDHVANWKVHGPNGWPEWYKTRRWGARHLSALAISAISEGKVIAITISSDAEIHVFHKSKAISDLSYPAASVAVD